VTDRQGFFLQLLGCTVAAAGFLWLLGRAFQKSDLWGTLIFFIPPLALVHVLVAFRRAWAPALVLLVGAVLVATPRTVSYFEKRYIDLGPRIKDVDGEKHVTLTGWDKTDYSFLEYHPETVVLQMANADVTDETLHYLEGMKGLRELDLSDTRVTDEGLKVLRQLPALRELRLRSTAVTDEGFRASLAPMESLRKVDVKETKVKGGTLRSWKNKNPDREYLN
jgi:hypothetical protein